MRTALLARIELEADLRHALERGELSLAYQPVVELQTGRPVGVEALARWTHPTRGPIPPLTFIPVAEEIGLIGAIGRWVLREACRQLAAWRQLAPELVLNVNLSALQLRDDRLASDVEQALLAYGLPGAALTLEITETCSCPATRTPRRACGASRPSGLSIAVDDFGTGYSSLSYLKQFPVDALKIDKSFVDAVGLQHGGQRPGAHDRRARPRHAPGHDRRGHREPSSSSSSCACSTASSARATTSPIRSTAPS